ncbi:hypothetical protein BGW42_007677 [Actinomortierella wolfii]|nr:hypothetical protein BGW42_007677 [Actinomortierella wolfii]
MKFKSAFSFGKKDKKKKTESSVSSPQDSNSDSNIKVAVNGGVANATTTSLHTNGVSEVSNTQTIGENGLPSASSPAVPPVPPVPSAPSTPATTPQQNVSLPTTAATTAPSTPVAGEYAQPHSANQSTTATTPPPPAVVSALNIPEGTPRPPANPQYGEPSADYTELRSPHALQDASNPMAATATAPGADLHRSDTLPPSYNSLNIPASASIHAASAPTPVAMPVDAMNAYVAPPLPPLPSSTVSASSSPLSAGVSTPYLGQQGSPYQIENPLPPLPPGATSPVHLHHQQQSSSSSSAPSTTPYPIPAQSSQPPQTYAMPHVAAQSMPMPVSQSPYGNMNYGHRPFVPPGSENTTYPIIMAIDWGTTFSSMAYAYQQDGEVHEVSTW